MRYVAIGGLLAASGWHRPARRAAPWHSILAPRAGLRPAAVLRTPEGTSDNSVGLSLSPQWSSTGTRRQGRSASLRDGLRPPLTPGIGAGGGLLRGAGRRSVGTATTNPAVLGGDEQAVPGVVQIAALL